MTTTDLNRLSEDHIVTISGEKNPDHGDIQPAYQAGFLKALVMVQERAKEYELDQTNQFNILFTPFQDLLNP